MGGRRKRAYYNLHRYYDPDSGQYLSQDPIGLEGGLRTHSYVHDPMQWVDPLGLAGCGVASPAARRDYLNKKFGRTGNLNQDITVRGYMKKIQELDVSTGRNKAVFWSGPGNFDKATSFARSTGRTTLEMTPGGKYLQNQALFKRLPADQAIKPWRGLSQRYAAQASGEINAFVNGARPTSIFNTVEYPALQKNIDVYKYIYRGY